jgi:PD-(D/E)XK endonuclease
VNSKDKGNVGEAKVLADLISKGIDIAQPFGDNLPFDLLAIDQHLNIYKIQVKYLTLKDGKVTLRNQRWSSNTKRNYVEKYTKAEVDVFAVYVPNLNRLIYVPASFVTSSTSFVIRFEATGNNQTKNVTMWDAFVDFPLRPTDNK